MTEEYNIDDLEAIIIDLLDGASSYYDIQYNTGLSEERCKEIEKAFGIIFSRYTKRHNLSFGYVS